jgi:hypothetical protein
VSVASTALAAAARQAPSQFPFDDPPRAFYEGVVIESVIDNVDVIEPVIVAVHVHGNDTVGVIAPNVDDPDPLRDPVRLPRSRASATLELALVAPACGRNMQLRECRAPVLAIRSQGQPVCVHGYDHLHGIVPVHVHGHDHGLDHVNVDDHDHDRDVLATDPERHCWSALLAKPETTACAACLHAARGHGRPAAPFLGGPP